MSGFGYGVFAPGTRHSVRGPDAFEAAVGQGGERFRQGGENRLAGVSAAERHFHGGAGVPHIVFAQHERTDLRPVVGRELGRFDDIARRRHRGFVAGEVVVVRPEVVGMVVVERGDDEGLGAVERERAIRLVGFDDERGAWCLSFAPGTRHQAPGTGHLA